MWCLDAVDRPKCKKAWAQNLGTWSSGAVRLNTAAGACSAEGAKGTEEKWRSLEKGWIKVNTDAGVDTTACSGSCGVVIRDQTGLVKAVAARWLDDVLDALTAEAMAAKEGLELAAENGYDSYL